MSYSRPGVYVEEISTLPPSVAEVSTAIPAFLGYTEKGPANEAIRIATMLEYEETFGKAEPTAFKAKVKTDGSISVAKEDGTKPDWLMWYCLRMYFQNGGGPCYIISLGTYQTAPTKIDHFVSGLQALEKEDEPTLIVLTDAVNLPGKNDYESVIQQTLAQCARLKDRFAILDVPDAKVAHFRNGIGSNHLKYGAAYYPQLKTTLNYAYEEKGVTVDWPVTHDINNAITVSYSGTAKSAKLKIVEEGEGAEDFEFVVEVEDSVATLTITMKGESAEVEELIAAWQTVDEKGEFSIEESGTADENVTPLSEATLTGPTNTLESIKDEHTQVYQQVQTELGKQRITLPPSSAMAGVYATVDRDRGVWKAPANVSLASVVGPTIKITNDEQEKLNVHPAAGKSINAIRSFTGKGTLVWGARTLAGNDNEWRYVNVRRLFNMIEESTQKATAFAVFESNNATTWLKVKGMIESYLYGLWEQGALAGPTAEKAYFVNVGLGTTMTPQDILEGRMIVDIGVAAVRPAEFIIIRFSHQLQQA